MKILQVSDSFYPNVDGPIDVMVSLAKEMRRTGYADTEFLVPDFPDRAEIEGFKIHRCFSVRANEGYRAALPALDRKIKKLIKEGGFDLIHLQSPFTLGKYALRAGKRYKIPVVITVHTKFRDEFERRLKSGLLVNFLTRYIIKCIDGCDAVTTVSQGMVDVLAAYGSRCGEVTVIPNGTAMPRLAADKSAVEKFRREHGLENKFAFLFVGRLAEVKNVQFSLKALGEVKKHGYGNFRFIIVGDGDYGKELKRLCGEYGIEDEVEFIGKITDKKIIAEIYSACDALLFPSVFDNASITVLEAAANGLPAVTLARTCSSERIESGVSGFVWESDPDAWTYGIERLICNPSLAKRAGAGAAEKVYADWEKIAKEYENLYGELCKKQSDK